MKPFAYYENILFDNERFFTVVLLPEKDKTVPTVIARTPYVGALENVPEEEIVANSLASYAPWLERGYAIVLQHCRGQGKSTGAFVPYIHEHEDSRMLRDWVRKQPFYNGEIFLTGGSYTASLQYAGAPYEKDVRGAVFEVQDSERYRLWYRNGQMRKGHANWHFSLYKPKCGLNKNFSMGSFSQLPLKGLSQRVFGERAEDFEEMLEAPDPNDSFWNTRNGGIDAKNATNKANIPLLLTTGYNDFYVGGVFDMWEKMDAQTKQQSALLVSPYNHGDGYDPNTNLAFPKGRRGEQFGSGYQIDWFDNIRKGTPLPYQKGVITYYRMFENRWDSDFYKDKTVDLSLPLGEDKASFVYDPLNPPRFGGEGIKQDPAPPRSDVVTLYTQPLQKDVFVKGKMRVSLSVSSDCEDTSFYVGIGIEKPQGDYRLRHDITSLSYQLGTYRKDSVVKLDFTFDEIAFLLQKGERLRVDITSTDDNAYVCHTNKSGPYYLQTETTTAVNTIYLENSQLILPIEQ